MILPVAKPDLWLLPATELENAWESVFYRLRVEGPGLKRPMAAELRQPFLLVGRGRGPGLVLPDRQISRRHAYLHLSRRGVYHVDLTGRPTEGDDAPSGSEWVPAPARFEMGPYSLKLECVEGNGTPQVVEPADMLASGADLPPIRLSLRSPEGKSAVRWLRRPLTLVGREAPAHLQLKHPSISQPHCLFLRDAHGLWLADLRSRLGTYVDGQAVTFRKLKLPCRIRLGQVMVEIDAEEGTSDVTADGAGLPEVATSPPPLRITEGAVRVAQVPDEPNGAAGPGHAPRPHGNGHVNGNGKAVRELIEFTRGNGAGGNGANGNGYHTGVLQGLSVADPTAKPLSGDAEALNDLTARLAQLERRVQELADRPSDTREGLESLRGELNALRGTLVPHGDRLEQQAQSLTDLRTLADTLAGRVVECEKASAAWHRLVGDFSAHQEAILRRLVDRSVHGSQEALDQQRATIQEQTQRLEHAVEAVGHAATQRQDRLAAELAGSAAALRACEERQTQMESQLGQAHRALAELRQRGEVDRMQADSSPSSSATDAANELAGIVGRCDHLQAEVAGAARQLRALSETVERERSQVDSRCADLREICASAATRVERLTERADAAEASLSQNGRAQAELSAAAMQWRDTVRRDFAEQIEGLGLACSGLRKELAKAADAGQGLREEVSARIQVQGDVARRELGNAVEAIRGELAESQRTLAEAALRVKQQHADEDADTRSRVEQVAQQADGFHERLGVLSARMAVAQERFAEAATAQQGIRLPTNVIAEPAIGLILPQVAAGPRSSTTGDCRPPLAQFGFESDHVGNAVTGSAGAAAGSNSPAKDEGTDREHERRDHFSTAPQDEQAFEVSEWLFGRAALIETGTRRRRLRWTLVAAGALLLAGAAGIVSVQRGWMGERAQSSFERMVHAMWPR